MYIVDGIAYAGDPAPMIKVSGVRPMKDHKLWVRFSTGTAKIMDFRPLLKTPAFATLLRNICMSMEWMQRRLLNGSRIADYYLTTICKMPGAIAPQWLREFSINGGKFVQPN